MKHGLSIDNISLVEECKGGNKDALNLFYTRFAPRMLRVASRYVHEQKDAEDIVHDGFIVALTHLDSIKDPNKVDFWLASIIKNLSLQFLKSQDVAEILHDIPDMEEEQDPENFIDIKTLEYLINKLPTGYQKVFRLAVLENKSHKEIGKLLGIAPNSSSSQLFHAKLMMRKLISEYKKQAGVFSLLLLALSGGIWYWRSMDNNHLSNPESRQFIASSNKKEIPESNKDTEKQTSSTQTPVSNSVGQSPSLIAKASSTSQSGRSAVSGIKSHAPEKIDKEAAGDSTRVNGNIMPENRGNIAENNSNISNDVNLYPEKPVSSSDPTSTKRDDLYYAYNQDLPPIQTISDEWSVGFGVNPGLLSFNNIETTSDAIASTPPYSDDKNDPVQPENPDEYTHARSYARDAYKNYNDVAHHNYMPISFSLAVNKPLTKTIGLETGLTYTYLHSKFETSTSRVNCHWHYLGIPLKVNLNTFSSSRFRLYASIGGEVDIPLYSNAVAEKTVMYPDLLTGKFNSSVVWSLSASYGISYNISNRIEIFVEPTLNYHFEHNHIVPNTWTDDKWGLSIPFGFRFKW